MFFGICLSILFVSIPAIGLASAQSALGVSTGVVRKQTFSSSVSYSVNTTQNIPNGYFYYYTFYVPNLYPNVSYGFYGTAGNATVSTALMTASQFSSFNSTGSFAGGYIADQNGTLNFDGMLFTEGSYYLVVYSYSALAHVHIILDVASDLEAQNASTYAGLFETVKGGMAISIPLHYETLGSVFNLTVIGFSNETVSYSLFSQSTGSTIFSSPPETVTNLSLNPFTYNYTFVNLPKSVYQLEVSNSHAGAAYVYVEYHIYPKYVNPYLWRFLFGAKGAPTGIAAYGVTNESGVPLPYFVASSSVMGLANITTIQAYNATAAKAAGLNDPYMASLQLNLILAVRNSDGSLYVYWPQNVPTFYTDKHMVQLSNNVLNMTGDGAWLSNSTITSPDGLVTEYNNSGSVQYYYGDYLKSPVFSYALPFEFALLMNESVVPGQGVLLSMGFQVMANGTAVQGEPIYWFDNITIHDPSVSQASFVVSGYRYTPVGASSFLGSYYDAELVFGGGGNGEVVQFTELSCALGLFYYSDTQHGYTAFPSYYSFGSDTAEATTNVHVDYAGGGYAALSTGVPDYTYLGLGSSMPAGAPTSTVTTPTTQASTLTQSTATFSPTTQVPAPAPAYTGDAVLAGVIITVVVLVSVFLIVRRRPLPPPPPPAM
jgi:thermopsin